MEDKQHLLSVDSHLREITKQLEDLSIQKQVFTDEEDGGSEKIQLISTLFCNIAACCLKQAKFQDCVDFCDRTLQFDSESTTGLKALYRKSQALFKLNRFAEAIRYCKILLTKDPENGEAKKFMLELKSIIEAKNSITSKALEMISEVEADYDNKVVLTASQQKANKNKLSQIFGSIIDDTMLAKSLCLKGFCEKLWKLYEAYPTCLKILRKLVDYKDCNVFVLKAMDMPAVYQMFVKVAKNSLDDALASNGDAVGSLMQAVVFLYMNKGLQIKSAAVWNEKFGEDTLVVDGQKMDPDLFCLNLCILCLRAKDKSVKKYAIEGLVKFVGESQVLSLKFVKDCDGLTALLSMITPEKRKASETSELNEEEEVRNLRITIQQVAIILGRILPSLKDDDLIKDYGLKFSIPALRSDDLFEQIKGCSALVAIFIANLELGMALVTEQEGMILELLLKLIKSAPAKTQGLICEIFANMANNEKGRSTLKGDERFTVMLNVLVQSQSINVRTNASITLAKLNATKFDKESNQGMIVLSSVFNLLKEKTTEEEKGKGVEAISYVINDTDVKMMLCTSTEGVEILKTLVQLAAEKKESATAVYAYGLAHIFENLSMSEDDKKREKLKEMEVTPEQWQQFQKLTKTETDGHKPDPPESVSKRVQAFVANNGAAALKNMVLNGGSARVRAAVARTYCNIAVFREVRGQMFSQGAPRALIDLTADRSESIFGKEEARGRETYDQRERDKRLSETKKLAAHALAKMFITTDPNLIGFSVVMDSLKPLVDNLKLSDEDLICFETSMALTNLSTVSYDVKRKIINLNTIKYLEYASYNDDLLVRRSACECLSNLVPEKEMIEVSAFVAQST